ncbi:MAG: tetratricopeptide repeat protein [Verrucomicrobia bacterium]|nr:tetratricopeptide repeat protein [Verrucomicrobiota bacterium]
MNAHGNPKRHPSPGSLGKASMVTLSLIMAGCSPSGERALIEGDRLLQIGKSTEAIPLLERSALDLPQNAPALNHLGLAYHASGKTNEARRAYLRALEVDRNRIEATYNLAITYLERGELLEAEKGLRAYLVAHPTDAAVWEVLAQLQFQSGRWDDAERSFATIQPTGAISADGWNTRGLLSLRKRRFKDAVNCFQYALSLDPAATTPLYNLGVAHQLQGDRRSAAAQYRRWLAVNSGSPQSAPVQELIRQWETPATPPTALVSTNAPTPFVPQRPGRPTAPVAPTQRTNAVAVTEAPRPLATTTLPASPARTTEPPAAKPVAPPQIIPPPPLQVVNVQEDPPLRPAQDEPVAKPAAKPVVAVPTGGAAPAPQKPTELAAPAITSPSAAEGKTTPTALETDDANPPAKRSLWQRVTPGKWANPVQWFRKEADTNAPATPTAKPPAPASAPASPKKATPLTAPTARVATPQPTVLEAPSKPAARTEIAQVRRPAPPRYVRRAVGLLPAGNRTAAEPHFQQGIGAHQRRDLINAAAQYRRATEIDPSFHEAYHNLALVALDQGDVNLALVACEQALLLRPADSESRRSFAVALKQAGHPQDAAEQIELFLAAKPTETALHLAAAGLYAGELDDPAKARTHYEFVLALEPSHPQAAAIRGWLASHPK